MRKNRLQLFMPFLLIISFFFCLLTVAADVLRSQPQLHDSFDEFLRSSGSMENRAEDRVDDSDEGQPFGIQHQQGGGRRGAEGGGMRGMMAEEKPVPPPGEERGKELRDSPAAAIRGLDLENFCFGNGDAFPLGPCSSTFLKCGRFNAVRRFTFEECPLGNVFVGKECKPARKVRDCFLPDVNLLNDATEKLSQAVDFCARKEPFEPVLYFFDGPAPEDKCSRQALLCRGSASPPLAISCPSGKVLNVKTIGCVESPDQCAFVSGPAQTPIRQHLLQLLCREQHSQAGQQPFTAPMFPQSMQASKSKDRCRNWYFVCQASEEPELVFCDNGKMFDPAKRICRRILPEDQCPNLGACRGWEWRMSPVGECRPDFLFCNGMRPQLFQCERQGEVFKDGECTLASNACDVCQPGEMKRSTDKCEEFFLCERDTSASSAGRTRWRQFICTNGRLFHPQRRQCVQPTEFQCPTKTACQEGDSYSVECGDFFLCAQGRYVAGKCPDMTRWDAQERRCVFSAECRQFKQEQQPTAVGQPQQKCLDGQTRPSADCKHFEECLAGAWVSRRCQEYASDRLKDPCRFCSEPGAGQQKDFYPLERLLPDGFNPFDGQGVRQRRCVEGEKIVNRHDCARFMECVDGDWFNLACPGGHFFSPRTQGCVLASSANSSAVPMCQELIPAASGSPAGQSPAESVHLLPLYSANDSLTISGAIGPGAGPPPELGDQELRRNYEGVFQFCTAQSAQRIANPYDCTKYRECALAQGGYYAEKQCTVGAQFDPTQLACTYNYTCSPSNCVDSIREGLKDCGKAKECRQGQWQELVCPGEMAFVDGQCSQRIRCQSTNPVFHGQCLDGHTRPHASDCSKYLLCRYGQFLEENCNLGHRFNPKIGRCDPLYECPAKNRPPCYEGESRAVTAISATSSQQCQSEYELCRDGQYQRQNCPYGQQFAQSRCQAAANCQQQNSGGGGTASGSSSGGGTGGQQKCKESPGAAGFRADGQNCSKFYQCAQGNWVPKDCAKGTVFNPTLGVCDWPANVPGC